jgi:hypothetical protein
MSGEVSLASTVGDFVQGALYDSYAMGMDSVELVLAVEEAFDITIGDEEATNIRTVGELLDVIMGKLQSSERSMCESQRSFHVLRRSAQEAFNASRKQFRPNAKLEDVVPITDRRLVWFRWKSQAGAANWPELVLPESLSLGLFLGSLAIAVVVTWSIGRFSAFGYWSGLVPGIAILLFSYQLATRLTRSYATAFPEDCARVRDLALLLLARSPEVVGVERATWTRSEAYSVLRNLIIKQIGVTQFDESSRFADDLKMD